MIILCVCFFSRADAQFVKGDTSILSAEVIAAHLNFLANDSLRGRGNYTKELHVAAEYIASQFQQLNLQVLPPFKSYYQLFTGKTSNKGVDKSDTLMAADYQKVLKNVIGVLPGTTKPSEIVIFSAHYDHMGSTGPAARNIFNGANDNASGVAAMLALAQYYATRKDNSRTLVFCAFAGEELGLLGSKVLADGINAQMITCMINLEMLGRYARRNKNSFFITGAQHSNVAQIMKENLKGHSVRISREPSMEKQLFARSDNYPFALKGIPAHTIMSGDDDDPCYHQTCDEVQRLDIVNMEAIVRAVATGVETIVNGADTPTRIKKLAHLYTDRD